MMQVSITVFLLDTDVKGTNCYIYVHVNQSEMEANHMSY